MYVPSDILSRKLIDTPTVSPSISPRSLATRSANVIADTRLGCVTAIIPLVCHPNSYKYWNEKDQAIMNRMFQLIFQF